MDDWRRIIESFYPDLLQRTYCVPPVIFNRVPYKRDTIGGQPVLVLQSAITDVSSIKTTSIRTTSSGTPAPDNSHRLQNSDAVTPDDGYSLSHSITSVPDIGCSLPDSITSKPDDCRLQHIASMPDDSCSTSHSVTSIPDDSCGRQHLASIPDNGCSNLLSISSVPDNGCSLPHSFISMPDDGCSSSQSLTPVLVDGPDFQNPVCSKPDVISPDPTTPTPDELSNTRGIFVPDGACHPDSITSIAENDKCPSADAKSSIHADDCDQNSITSSPDDGSIIPHPITPRRDDECCSVHTKYSMHDDDGQNSTSLSRDDGSIFQHPMTPIREEESISLRTSSMQDDDGTSVPSKQDDSSVPPVPATCTPDRDSNSNCPHVGDSVMCGSHLGEKGYRNLLCESINVPAFSPAFRQQLPPGKELNVLMSSGLSSAPSHSAKTHLVFSPNYPAQFCLAGQSHHYASFRQPYFGNYTTWSGYTGLSSGNSLSHFQPRLRFGAPRHEVPAALQCPWPRCFLDNFSPVRHPPLVHQMQSHPFSPIAGSQHGQSPSRGQRKYGISGRSLSRKLPPFSGQGRKQPGSLDFVKPRHQLPPIQQQFTSTDQRNPVSKQSSAIQQQGFNSKQTSCASQHQGYKSKQVSSANQQYGLRSQQASSINDQHGLKSKQVSSTSQQHGFKSKQAPSANQQHGLKIKQASSANRQPSNNKTSTSATRNQSKKTMRNKPYNMWAKDPDPEAPTTPVYNNETRDDFAQQHVLHCLQELGHHRKEVMVVLSQVNFSHYLNKPAYAAACANFPRPGDLPRKDRRGDFDILIIHRHYGVLVGEIKAVGFDAALNKAQDEADADVTGRVLRTVRQLNKSETVMKHMLSDVVPDLAVQKTLIFPYVSRQQLKRVLDKDQKLEQALHKTLDADAATNVLDLCLCEDQLSHRDTPWHVLPVLPELTAWWEKRMLCSHPHRQFTDDAYVNIVARFVGPATTVSVHCVVPPRVEVRTEGEAVSEVGERLARVVLTPRQAGLVSRPQRLVCLTGPPGTGKTLLLVLKGLHWLRQGRDVHVVSSDPFCQSASRLIVYQMKMTLKVTPKMTLTSSSATQQGVGKIHFHQFDFYKKPTDVQASIDTLTEAAQEGQLFVLLDELDFSQCEIGPGHTRFVTVLSERVPHLHLWAASVKHSEIPKCLQVEPMTLPLRSSPAIIREVQKGIDWAKDKVFSYTHGGVTSPSDGPKVIRLCHQGPGHEENWPVSCAKCGEEVAGVLKQLHVGITGRQFDMKDQSTPRPPPLLYRDVLVLTRGVELCDVITDDKVKSLACGFVLGLRASGFPVQVVWWRDDLATYVGGVEDIAVAQKNRVTVTDWDVVTGLERKVVVYLPGRYSGVDDGEGDDVLHDAGRLYAMSRCTSQLVLVDVPNKGTSPGGSGVS